MPCGKLQPKPAGPRVPFLRASRRPDLRIGALPWQGRSMIRQSQRRQGDRGSAPIKSVAECSHPTIIRSGHRQKMLVVSIEQADHRERGSLQTCRKSQDGVLAVDRVFPLGYQIASTPFPSPIAGVSMMQICCAVRIGIVVAVAFNAHRTEPSDRIDCRHSTGTPCRAVTNAIRVGPDPTALSPAAK
jgi:hypothetical protein